MKDSVIRAYAYLLRAFEPPARAAHAYVAVHGAVEVANRIRAGELPPAVREGYVREVHLADVDRDMALIESGEARLITPDSDEWPAGRLAALSGDHQWMAPPLALWVRGAGSLAELTRTAVSIVGARAATGYGEQVASDFGYNLAGEGVTVVSGAAYGINAAAHRGALAAQGPTVAVLACGVDMPYPAGYADLLATIARQGGVVVSELPPGTSPARHRFLGRNRVTTALGASTVVVESGARSGSQNAAASAHAMGRPVLAVPGPITSAMSAGTNQMLRTGVATAVTSVAEILQSTRFTGDRL